MAKIRIPDIEDASSGADATGEQGVGMTSWLRLTSVDSESTDVVHGKERISGDSCVVSNKGMGNSGQPSYWFKMGSRSRCDAQLSA